MERGAQGVYQLAFNPGDIFLGALHFGLQPHANAMVNDINILAVNQVMVSSVDH